MRKRVVLAGVAGLLLSGGAAHAETFDVSAEPASCTVYRQADTGASTPSLVGVRHFIGAPGATLLIAVPTSAAIPMATTRAALSPAGPAIGQVEVAKTAAGAQVFLVPVDPRGGAPLAGRATLSGLSTSPAEIDFDQVDRMIRAGEGCERGLLANWGFGGDGATRVARPPVPAKAGWPGIDDVPQRDMDSVNGRFTTVAWRVGPDAQISDCRVVETSGLARLDTLGCAVLRRKLSYREAARDAQGQPVEAVMVRRIRWGPID
ncbi:hypothetical protein [uncultured Sphingomonas sp.]|uniref:hypothetical protein n=1 Tax=uncultured Sphingomonas sp. TaxID=158754 RepID=UPI0025DA3270|nr:hypothetical protein [uncultured Sphingomonas sp.]